MYGMATVVAMLAPAWTAVAIAMVGDRSRVEEISERSTNVRGPRVVW